MIRRDGADLEDSSRIVFGEVKARAISAAGIEVGIAMRTLVSAGHVGIDGEFSPAGSTENGFGAPCGTRPWQESVDR
jgi:hypothetical protein